MENEILKRRALGEIRAKEKQNLEELESRLNLDEDNNVFTKEVEPLSSWQVFLNGLGNFCIKTGLFIWDWIKTIFFAILNIFVSIYKIGRYGTVHVYNFFKGLCHKFKYNDVWGRLSYVIFGAGSFGHKQYTNGVLYLLFEIGYIVFFSLVGANSIQGIWNLGVVRVDPNWVFTPTTIVFSYEKVNSLLNLITGLFTLISTFLFIYVWYRSIISGYNNYRIANFVNYNAINEKLIPMANEIDNHIKEIYHSAYDAKGDLLRENLESADFEELYQGYYSVHGTTNEELKAYKYSVSMAKKELSDIFEKYYEELDNSFERKYAKYAYIETIKAALHAHKNWYFKTLKKEKIEYKYNLLLLTHGEENNEIKQDMELSDEERENKLNEKLLKDKKTEHIVGDKRTAIEKQISEFSKTYSPYVSQLSRINYNTYAKFNDYFFKLSEYNVDLKFYQNYQKLVEIYDSFLGQSEEANTSNLSQKDVIKSTAQDKVNEVNERYQEIYEKKADILNKIKELKLELKETLKTLAPEEREGCKIDYQERINKLDGQYNSFANDKLLHTLQKEETSLILKRAKDDTKYLKVNYTDQTYAATETINKMLVEFDFEYRYAKSHIALIEAHLSESEIESKIEELEADKEEYVNLNGDDKFVGKSKTFINQLKSLFNDKFHITILALPILGATLFCVIPLIFSILIAFTNFDRQHQIGILPFQWTGFETFIRMFQGTDPIYGAIGAAIGQTFLWTFVWAIFATFSNYFLGIIVALMINKEGIKLKKLWRTIFVLTIAIPAFISLSTIAKMLADGTGVLANLYKTATGTNLGFAKDRSNNALVTKIIIIVVNIWVGIPYTVLSTTGILMNIPKDLYESSRIDGAGPATQFFKITMPYILFVTGPSLITTFIGNFNNFGVIYFLTAGGPTRSTQGAATIAPGYTDLFITYIYTLVTGDSYKYYNVASSLGIIIFIVCSFISIILYNKTGAVAKEDQFQ